MLRITPVASQDSAPQLKLEGKLIGPWVDELIQACGRFSEATDRLSLDLSAVTFADPAGVQLLRKLLRQGIALAACSGLVAELLHVETP